MSRPDPITWSCQISALFDHYLNSKSVSRGYSLRDRSRPALDGLIGKSVFWTTRFPIDFADRSRLLQAGTDQSRDQGWFWVRPYNKRIFSANIAFRWRLNSIRVVRKVNDHFKNHLKRSRDHWDPPGSYRIPKEQPRRYGTQTNLR
jgi:hypothetical protein